MTLIFVEGDHNYEYEQISDHEFKEYSYFHEESCDSPSSSMLGKYCRITIYKTEVNITDIYNLVYNGTPPIDFFSSIREEWGAEVVSASVEVNKGYDPVTFEKLFTEKARAYAKIEKETGLRLY